MALSAFDDKSRAPDESALTDTLGTTAALWHSLREHVQQEYGPLTEQWNYAGAKYGWSLRLKDSRRVVVYCTPCKNHFLASLVLGKKAVQSVRESSLPATIKRLVEAAKEYAEGRGVRLEVRTKADLASVRKLTAIKMAR